MIPAAEHRNALLTDLYQLTMNASYVDNGKADEVASFEMFVRGLPRDWGYLVAVGLDEAVDYACSVRFTDDDVAYLQGLGVFSDGYLDYLRHFRFEGEVSSVAEGTPMTNNAPMLRVTAERPQAQLLETALLNIVNSQTLIASKASRVVNAAGPSKVVDFGLRRAQGFDAGVMGARAAYVAGVVATSNVEAARDYGIPPSGTMAHSYVMGFPDEITAFRSYARTFPDESVFLIDTYDTIRGAENAATVAKEMEAQGHRLKGVRLDSGNMRGLSKKIRRILDREGLRYVKIVVSSDLNEYKIDLFTRHGAPVDTYGVGTEMITAKPVAALSGVYKLIEDGYGPRIKLSDSKRTYPGRKQVSRVEKNGRYVYDVLQLLEEEPQGEPLLKKAAERGRRLYRRKSLGEIRDYSIGCVAKLPDPCKKIRAPQPYPLHISGPLQSLTDKLTNLYSKK